jgi:hypothetical protein
MSILAAIGPVASLHGAIDELAKPFAIRHAFRSVAPD